MSAAESGDLTARVTDSRIAAPFGLFSGRKITFEWVHVVTCRRRMGNRPNEGAGPP